jgi:nitroreductase
LSDRNRRALFRRQLCKIPVTKAGALTGQRGIRYAQLEPGHAVQNVCFEATALGLGCMPVGAFDDLRLRQVLRFDTEEEPLYLVPIGPTKGQRASQVNWHPQAGCRGH